MWEYVKPSACDGDAGRDGEANSRGNATHAVGNRTPRPRRIGA